ncbi:MAG: hypothetical protein ACPG7W_03495 [Paracoccaceae bacterium]
MHTSYALFAQSETGILGTAKWLELGADAVISAQISDVAVCALSWGCRHASGTAVTLAK